MKIGFYKSHAKVERNKGFVAVYNYDKDWDQRVLQNRALKDGLFFVRDAFPHEVQECEHSHRAVSWKYDDLESLLADEKRSGCSDETIMALRQAACKA